MLDDDFFELDEDLLNATDYFGKNIDEIGKYKATFFFVQFPCNKCKSYLQAIWMQIFRIK